MITLLPPEHSLRVSLLPEATAYTDCSVGLLLGFIQVDSETVALVCDENGHLWRMGLGEFTADIRYHHERDQWLDLEALRSPQSDQDD